MKRLLSMVSIALVCVGVILMFPSGSCANEKVITLKATNWFPVGCKQDLGLHAWCKDLEKRSGGKMKVSYYGGGTLVPAAQSYDAAVKGIVDVSNCVLGYTMGRFPFSQVLDLPLGFPEGSGPTKIANEFYQKFKPKEFDDVKVLWFHEGPGGFLHTRTKPVTKLEDLQGMKLRCYGSNAKFVGQLGAAAVAMPMPEVYDALSKGVVDGLLSQFEPLQGFRTGEHIKYTTENRDSAWSAAFVVVMNKKKFDSLPEDIRAIIDEMSPEYIEKYDKQWTEIDAEGKDWMAKRGAQFISLSPEEEARWYEKGSKPLIEAYIKDMEARGLPGAEAVKFLQETLKTYKK
ncbi:MAG: TRAP transporter substrate-binding protein [Desulfomonile tiedjei]|uniref:TRAP transporter substrate-binding protein n=1 Tax=Desulfomonile tiedjei TaxID=2358 RepID=A0A9D6V2R2_9BACT|nr:TRAP transporter substrate-binding protein [Desulfomonile tiedjei]